MMPHPFENIKIAHLKRIYWPLLVITLVIMGLLNWVSLPLNTEAAPLGIVSYEIAGSVTQAQNILASWDPNARLAAAFGLGLDYLFMVAYSTTLGLGCIWAADVLKRRAWPLANLGARLAWGQWLAALLDAVENMALFVLLITTVQSPWPELARWCALVKFALIFVGLIYIFLALAASLTRPSTRAHARQT